MCAGGKQQSPIDIQWEGLRAARYSLPLAGPGEHLSGKLELVHPQEALLLVSQINGHPTLSCAGPDGSCGTALSGRYDLVQLHFHSPSEHTVNGASFPMELHMVHQDASTGKLAVVGVFFDTNRAERDADPELDRMFNAEVVSATAAQNMTVAMDLAALSRLAQPPAVDGTDRYWHYSGSLTTPPCSEEVSWYLSTRPVSLSATQVLNWQTHLWNTHPSGNSRPPQPMHGRVVQLVPFNQIDSLRSMVSAAGGERGVCAGGLLLAAVGLWKLLRPTRWWPVVRRWWWRTDTVPCSPRKLVKH